MPLAVPNGQQEEAVQIDDGKAHRDTFNALTNAGTQLMMTVEANNGTMVQSRPQQDLQLNTTYNAIESMVR